jgi:hypothetical protein
MPLAGFEPTVSASKRSRPRPQTARSLGPASRFLKHRTKSRKSVGPDWQWTKWTRPRCLAVTFVSGRRNVDSKTCIDHTGADFSRLSRVGLGSIQLEICTSSPICFLGNSPWRSYARWIAVSSETPLDSLSAQTPCIPKCIFIAP